MKITVITGSAHRHGTSALLADKFIEGAKEAGHEVFRFDAAFKNVHGCLGCDTCNKKANGCVFKDDMEEINPYLLQADVIVFASPVYYFNISAHLKSVIDRFYANNSALRGNKKAALLLSMAEETAEAAEGPEYFFKHFTGYMDWENLGVVSATSSETRADIEKTNFPRRAYELGRNLQVNA